MNQPGGLNQAICCETKLRSAIYVKVESSVALNADDVDLTTNKVVTGYNDQEEPIYSENFPINDGNATNDNENYGWQYIDMSGANLQPDVCASSFTKPYASKAYRIILPNNWVLENMMGFQDRGSENYGNMAAVYSYSGTTLRLMEISDAAPYAEDALKNKRIVRKGTTAIEVVGKLVENGGNYVQYGDLGNHLIAALNQADDDPDDNSVNNIKSIIINVGQANTILTEIDFTNTNIENFSMSGVKNRNNANLGPGVNVTGCTNLKTIDVSNSTLISLDAHGVTTLESVNTSGTKMNTYGSCDGSVNLSNTSVSTFTTNTNTEFYGKLDLTKTNLTSFATAAKVNDDIILNETSLTKLDVRQTQFQNETSMIYVRKSSTEGNDYDKLTGTLSPTNKILVPQGFAESRIIPNISGAVEAQAYTAPPYVYSDTDMHLHVAAPGDNYTYWYVGDNQAGKVLTITTTEAGTLSTLLNSENANYSSSTELVKVKIVGKLNNNDQATLNTLNTQILDLSEATVDANTTITGMSNSNIKFLILPNGMTRDDETTGIVNATSLANFSGLLSAVSFTYDANNNFDFYAYNKVIGTLQPALVASGKGNISTYMLRDGDEDGTTENPDNEACYVPDMSKNVDKKAVISGQINAYDL